MLHFIYVSGDFEEVFCLFCCQPNKSYRESWVTNDVEDPKSKPSPSALSLAIGSLLKSCDGNKSLQNRMAYKSRILVSCRSSFDRLLAIMEALYCILLVISEYLCNVHAEKLIGKQKN